MKVSRVFGNFLKGDQKHLTEVIEDVHLFCCSFVKEVADNDMSVDEVSAFDEEA